MPKTHTHTHTTTTTASGRGYPSWLRRDRGDSPVPTAIIIAGLALIAVGVLAWLVSYVNGFMEAAPAELPGPGAPGGPDGGGGG